MGLNPDFWRGRRVFLTGHTGFKGGWMALWLARMGAQVTGFALAPPTNPSLFEAANVGQGITSIIGDIRDEAMLAGAVTAARPEIVLHLAAQPLVRDSYNDPIGTYATNVMGTAHLLNALRGLDSVKSVFVVTSDKCYENREWEYPYREIDPMGGYDPYSSSKGCTELVTAAFRRSYFSAGLCLGSGRAGNVIGGGDWARDRLMTDIVAALAAGKPVLIRNPKAERPWQHVLEPVYGYLRWAELSFEKPQELARGWNFGPSTAATRSVSWIVDRMCRNWGGGARWQPDGDSHLHEAMLLRLDSSLAARHLGWQGRLGLEDTLDWTTDWFRAFHQGGDMRAVTLAQIAEYEKLVAAD